MNEKCKVFLSEISKKLKKGYETSDSLKNLKTGSPESLLVSFVL
jgi:hypothetical protein